VAKQLWGKFFVEPFDDRNQKRKGSGILLPVLVPLYAGLRRPKVRQGRRATMVQNQATQLLRVKDICRELQMSRATVYRQIDTGDFPSPIYLGERMPRWHSSQLSAWLAGKTRV
jgi:prophage regulatory protein